MDEEIELIEYLKNLVGKTLHKEEQKELAEKLNIRRNGKLLKSVSVLNGYLMDNYNMILISKHIREQGKKVTIWILNNKI